MRSVRIDAHVHIFPPEIVADRERFSVRDPFFGALYASPRSRLATAEDLVAELDASGFDRAIAVGWGWQTNELCRMHNDYLIEAVHRFPDRITGFAAFQPTTGDSGIVETERALDGGLSGVGELMPHGQDYRLDDIDRMRPIAELAIAREVPILTHSSEPVGHIYPGKGDVVPDRLLTFITAFPGLKVIAAHWGGGLPFYALMPEVKRAITNVWFDSAASPYLYDPRIYRIVRDLVGIDRILFGSDFRLLPIARCAAQVEALGLPEIERDAILGLNAAQLLKLAAD